MVKLNLKIQSASLAALLGLFCHMLWAYASGGPFLTDMLAEWIMARTPSHWAVPLMAATGEWAKPFAATGALAILGFFLFASSLPGSSWALILGLGLSAYTVIFLGYESWPGLATFYLPAAALLLFPRSKGLDQSAPPLTNRDRRRLLSTLAMSSGTVAVALEAFIRNRALAARAVTPTPLYPLRIPPAYQQWGDGLVRKAITPLREFYVMSKNTVDPAPDPQNWRLKIQFAGKTLREYSYAELLNFRREERYVSLRCVSNSLKSNLMGTGYWSGLQLSQLLRREELPPGALEMAVIGLDGHGDSFSLDYAFSGEMLLALGMNGDTLSRNHGFPIRLLSPRYYGFKSIKWIDRIDFVTQPYFGTWPKMGYTKEPVIHPGAFVDKIRPQEQKLAIGGIAYSGLAPVREVYLRLLSADKAPLQAWVNASLEQPLSSQTFTRWIGALPTHPDARFLEVRVRDNAGRWQLEKEKPLFPDGVAGPTIRSL